MMCAQQRYEKPKYVIMKHSRFSRKPLKSIRDIEGVGEPEQGQSLTHLEISRKI